MWHDLHVSLSPSKTPRIEYGPSKEIAIQDLGTDNSGPYYAWRIRDTSVQLQVPTVEIEFWVLAKRLPVKKTTRPIFATLAECEITCVFKGALVTSFSRHPPEKIEHTIAHRTAAASTLSPEIVGKAGEIGASIGHASRESETVDTQRQIEQRSFLNGQKISECQVKWWWSKRPGNSLTYFVEDEHHCVTALGERKEQGASADARLTPGSLIFFDGSKRTLVSDEMRQFLNILHWRIMRTVRHADIQAAKTSTPLTAAIFFADSDSNNV